MDVFCRASLPRSRTAKSNMRGSVEAAPFSSYQIFDALGQPFAQVLNVIVLVDVLDNLFESFLILLRCFCSNLFFQASLPPIEPTCPTQGTEPPPDRPVDRPHDRPTTDPRTEQLTDRPADRPITKTETHKQKHTPFERTPLTTMSPPSFGPLRWPGPPTHPV